MDAIYNNIKKNNGNKTIINQNIGHICNNIKNFTEKDIISLLVDLNTYYKFSNNDIINYSFKILLSIINLRDCSRNVTMKICFDNLVMKKNHKYYSKIIKAKLLLDRVIINMDDEAVYDINDEYLLVNYLIYMLTKTCDDCYVIDNIIDVIKSNESNIMEQIKSKMINAEIKYNRLRNIVKYSLVDDIYRTIFNNLNFVDQHKFRIVNAYFQKFQIVRLMGVSIDENDLNVFEYSECLSQEILNNYKHAKYLKIDLGDEIINIDHMTDLRCLHFLHRVDYDFNLNEKLIDKLTNLRELCICGQEIKSFNHLTNLKKLRLSGFHEIDNISYDHISNLSQLEELEIKCIYALPNFNHMTDLKVLSVGKDCRIDDGSIKNLTKLENLCIEYGDNYNIMSLNHLTNLKILCLDKYDFVHSDTAPLIENECIKNLTQLEELYIEDARNITDLNHMTNLKFLNIDNCDNIDDEGIKKLTQLDELHISSNKKITDLNHLTNLKTLNIHSCNIGDSGIRKLTQLDELRISNNKKITNLNHLTNLKTLSIRSCDIGDNGIRKLTQLDELHIRNNKKITDLNHLTNLKTLNIHGCNIGDSGIRKLTQLEVLNDRYNANITNIEHMVNLKNVSLNYDKISIGSCLLLIKCGLRVKECYYRLGECYKNDKKYDEAIKNFNLASDNGSKKGSCMKSIGECYESKKYYDDAIKHYNLAMDNDSYKGIYLFRIGICYKNDKKYDEAIKNFNLAMDNGYDKNECIFSIGDCYRMKYYYSEAIKYYNQASNNYCSKNKCMFYIGVCFWMKGNYDSAIWYYKIASDDGYDKDKCIEYLNKCYRMKGDHNKVNKNNSTSQTEYKTSSDQINIPMWAKYFNRKSS